MCPLEIYHLAYWAIQVVYKPEIISFIHYIMLQQRCSYTIWLFKALQFLFSNTPN